MASNFQISSFKTKDNLHLKLYGDFDVNSAQELTNTLLMHGAGYWDIFIDTNDLETIHPFGRDTLQMNLRNFKKQLSNLFFIGVNKYKIAPN
jgi:anti-anti-sigma regulatory factor